VLPSSNRMRSPALFSAVVRRGSRARRGTLVVHYLPVAPSSLQLSAEPTVGLVVGRGVGDSVVRNRVSRRLRAQLAARLDRLPAHSATVVRALTESAGAESARLAHDLDAAFDRLGLRTADRASGAVEKPAS
jgi:ribonuclease P protein component